MVLTSSDFNIQFPSKDLKYVLNQFTKHNKYYDENKDNNVCHDCHCEIEEQELTNGTRAA